MHFVTPISSKPLSVLYHSILRVGICLVNGFECWVVPLFPQSDEQP